MTKENQTVPQQGILNEIGGEVSEESAPLLEFITKHGGKIAGAVLLFLLVTGLCALWQWHTRKSADDYLTEMAKITQMQNKDEALAALEALAKKVPDGIQNAIRLTLADLAIRNNNTQKAAEAFEACAKADGEGTVGTMAQLSLAMTHLKTENWQDALTLLTDLEKKFAPKVPSIVRELTAEAAQGAGNTKRAAELFDLLAQEETGDAAAYYRYRARLAAQTAEKPEQKKPEENKAEQKKAE